MSKPLFLISFIIILVLSFLLYHSTLNYYFFQDDFFEINISKAHNLWEFINFFKFRNDIIAYRPISLQSYFFLSHSIFGMDASGQRVISFAFLFSSVLLIIAIARKLTGKIAIGLLAAALWATSSIHFMTLTWVAGAYNIIGTFFWLLTSLLFLKFLETKKTLYYLATLVSFLSTVGSFEFSITWPAVFFIYHSFVLKNPLKKSIKIFSTFIIISGIYLVGRLFFIKVPQITEYHVAFNTKSIKALFWYLLWSFNVPEEFKKQILKNLIIFNQQFLWEYWRLVVISFIGVIWEVILGVFVPLFYILREKSKVDFRLLLLLVLWFPIAVLPVLFLPNHNFVMYLTLPLVGICFLIAYLVTQSKKRILAIPIIIIWLITSINTLSFYKNNSYIVTAQKTAAKFSNDLKTAFPALPPNSIVFYPLEGSAAKLAVLNQEAVKAIYNDPTIAIYYNKKELEEAIASAGKNRPVFIYSQ